MRNKPLHPPSPSSSARLRPAMALTLVGALVGATVACSLNPQPLPPGDGEDDRIAAEPTGEPSTGGGNFSDAASTPLDAQAPPLVDAGNADAAPVDAARDGGDADAATDAAADAATRD